MILALEFCDQLLAVAISAVVAAFVAYWTQRFIEYRERRNRRDQLRLELYLEVVDLVLDNELALAECGTEGDIPSVELQAKRLRISHRLKLLASSGVQAAYDAYRCLVIQETSNPISNRRQNPNDVDEARNRLIERMAEDVQQSEFNRRFFRR